MRFLCLYKPAAAEGAPPTEQEMSEMGKFIDELEKAGVLLSTEGCLPSSTGARVRRTDGKFTVIDGPFAEAKELVGGIAIIQVGSKDEAIELTKRFLNVAGDGESEIRNKVLMRTAVVHDGFAHFGGTTSTQNRLECSPGRSLVRPIRRVMLKLRCRGTGEVGRGPEISGLARRARSWR